MTTKEKLPKVQLHNPKSFAHSVQKILTEQLDLYRNEFSSISPHLGQLVDSIQELLQNGKRLRPAFCYWGWRACANSADLENWDNAVVAAAASLELLQACALIHDDVMDNSDTRRGKPATHVRFAELHRRGGWHGNAAAFGASSAILIGDLCLSWSDSALSNAHLPPELLQRAKVIFDQMRTELMGGQYLDLLEQAFGGGDTDRAITVLKYKSAKYTIERPLQIGVALARGDRSLMEQFSNFGLPLGVAFQLRDDVLGVFGDPDTTGKPAGDDLREGKQTLLIELTRRCVSDSQRDFLNKNLGNQDLDLQSIADLREIIINSKALSKTEERINQEFDIAMQALAQINMSSDIREILTELANSVIHRIK